MVDGTRSYVRGNEYIPGIPINNSYNLNLYMCVIVIIFNCTVYMHELYTSNDKMQS